MPITVPGTFRNGKVDLSVLPEHIPEESPVLVTFVPSGVNALLNLGISVEEAAEIRAGFGANEDWESPAMSVYDDYDESKSRIFSR